MQRDNAIALLRKVGLLENIIQHSIVVADKAVEIAKQIQAAGYIVNIETIEIGALLHDIGRVKSQGVRYAFHHAIEGGKILRQYGLPESIIRIVETHSLDALWPRTIEEKIVCYADKTVKGTHEISVNDRFDLWMKRYGKNELLLTAKNTILKIEKELSSLLTE